LVQINLAYLLRITVRNLLLTFSAFTIFYRSCVASVKVDTFGTLMI